MTTTEEMEKWMGVVMGRNTSGQYKNSNLVLINNSKKSIEERSKNDICPPLNYNRSYSEPLKPQVKKQRAQKPRIDPELMSRFMS